MDKTTLSERGDMVFSRAISAAIRAEALEHGEFNCERCGLAPGETDWTTGRKARLHIGLFVGKGSNGEEELSKLRATCSICVQGAKNITSVKPTAIWLLSQVRRAGHDEQLAVLKWLLKKFNREA